MAKHSSDDLTFEHWVEWVFDHPVSEPEWYQGEDAETDDLQDSRDMVKAGLLEVQFHAANGSLPLEHLGTALISCSNFCIWFDATLRVRQRIVNPNKG